MSVEVYRDEWGIPHLRADSARELAHAQGRNAAADRGWQIEVERHRSQGTSAAFLGPEAAGWDRFARQARIDDTARRCYRALDEETRGWLDAYVTGVDAGLRELGRAAREFARAGLEPGRWRPWTPLGIWLSTHILFTGLPGKLWRDEVVRRIGPGAVGLFATDGPGTSGSNGWLVTGDRTATGGPLIAGDPHRYIEDPGVYQQIRLACPEYDVVGLAVPGVPGIGHFGHTGTVAWAITNAMADYQDLYRERLRRLPDGGVEALGPDGWRPAFRSVETFEVAGEPPQEVEVVETERGTVVIGGPDEGEGIALRQPPRVREDLGFAALPALLRARTVADVDRAFDRWAEPVNVVQAADTEGGLLHRVAGAVPERDPENLLRVVPAHEPRHAWRGLRELPREPVGTVAVMANQRGLAAPLGIEFAPPHRADRIRELLDAHDVWTAPGMAAVHTDTRLASARPLLDLVARLDGLGPDAEALTKRLLAWDRHMDADSADAAAYARVRAAVVRKLAAHPAFAPLTGMGEAYPEVFRPWLALAPRIAYALETLLTTDQFPDVDRETVVREAVEEAAAATAAGETWGDRHRLAAWRALPEDGDEAAPGLPGDHDCVLSTSSVPGITDLSARGPAARYVWDVADRANSLWVVPLGASGIPGSPHRRDQLPLWLRGGLVPVITDWNRLTKETPMRESTVYERTVEGFGTVRVAPVDPVADLDVIHGWVREERARFWGMEGASREQVRETYEHLDSLTTHHAHLVRLDGEPVALFQTYEPEADRVSECYEVEDGDIGVHFLIAPAAGGAVRGFTGALMTVLVAYALEGHGKRRIVVEPDARNTKAVALLERAGFALGPEIVLPEIDLPEVFLPEKRARIAFLER
ncbi:MULTISPECIES: GNAT family N-acetyltransferase [unclassified Streptomyces]|uniref:GNAT family N-acetyltransferase n=1 Tax=unclassified Streptomyces TaxID=2593676 RepID=UPI0032545F81